MDVDLLLGSGAGQRSAVVDGRVILGIVLAWVLLGWLFAPTIGAWIRRRNEAAFERDVQRMIDQMEQATQRSQRITTTLDRARAQQEKAPWN